MKPPYSYIRRSFQSLTELNQLRTTKIVYTPLTILSQKKHQKKLINYSLIMYSTQKLNIKTYLSI